MPGNGTAVQMILESLERVRAILTGSFVDLRKL